MSGCAIQIGLICQMLDAVAFEYLSDGWNVAWALRTNRS